jgi:hypothetical protein
MTIQEYKAGQDKALDSASTQQVGIGGFTMFARVNDQTQYSTASPTSVVEDGSFIGDHLINAPIKLTISGDVSDIFIQPPPQSASESRIPTVAQMNSFLPKRTVSQIQRVNKVIDSAADRYRQINNSINDGIKIGLQASGFTGNKAGTKSLREQFVDFIESVHYGKQLVSISMPFRLHDSMAINDVTITRDNQRNALTFSLTAQKFRIAKTIFSDVSQFYKKPAPAVKSQVGKTADKGVQSPKSGDGAGAKKEKSLLSAIIGRS